VLLRAAQDELRESQRSLQVAQSLAHVGSWVAGAHVEEPVAWSAECAQIYGRPHEDPPTMAGLLAAAHPEDHARLVLASARARAAGGAFETEHRIVRPQGEVRWIHVKTDDELSSTSDERRRIGVVQDITERKRAAEELRSSEARYRRIVETTSEGVWMYDLSGTTTFMNRRMAEILGCTVQEAVGQSIYAFMDERTRAAAAERFQLRRQGESGEGTVRLTGRDGLDVWVWFRADALFDEHGNYESSLALVSDVTERRRGDETRDRLAAIVEFSDDAIISLDIEGIIRTWNRGAERLTQYSAAEAIGNPIAMLYVEGEAPALDPRQEPRGEGQKQFEMDMRRKDGQRAELSITLSVLRDDERELRGVSIIARDISESRHAKVALQRAEDQLRQAQKMEAIGSLAGGVAHDFNNLLSVILSYTSVILDGLRPSDPLARDLTEVQTAGLRASQLTRQLLTFSRGQVLQPVVLDLNESVLGMERMVARVLREDTHLSVRTSATTGNVHADPGQLEQVIMNLVVNARDAMPRGGSIVLETASVVLGEAGSAQHGGLAPGPYALLTVTDTGHGMDDATRERIFEPFFTTKDKTKGTGLGLATVYGIVQQSRGHIEVHTRLGTGTTFKIYLPQTSRPVRAATPQVETSATLEGTETVLLVEDEEQVRTIMRTILQRHGYHVLEAQNGGEAFLLCEQFEAPIHLLLTDVVMPRLSGRQLAERLTKLRPTMKVLFVSGYTDDTIVHHGVLTATMEFLEKPFVPVTLLTKVRQVLDR
jgi:two-component system cell cycle sensor histidine kinase/response regulator CckA